MRPSAVFFGGRRLFSEILRQQVMTPKEEKKNRYLRLVWAKPVFHKKRAPTREFGLNKRFKAGYPQACPQIDLRQSKCRFGFRPLRQRPRQLENAEASTGTDPLEPPHGQVESHNLTALFSCRAS